MVARTVKTTGDVYLTDHTKGIIMKDANNNCWRVTINTNGIGSVPARSLPCSPRPGFVDCDPEQLSDPRNPAACITRHQPTAGDDASARDKVVAFTGRQPWGRREATACLRTNGQVVGLRASFPLARLECKLP